MFSLNCQPQFAYSLIYIPLLYIKGILPKGPYLPCVSMGVGPCCQDTIDMHLSQVLFGFVISIKLTLSVLMLQPSPNRAGLSKDEELQLSWQVLFTVTKNPGTTNIIPYKIQVYQWQYMYNNTFHNKNHLTSSSYCVQMPWHQLSQQLGRRHLLTNHHISFKFLYMTKHQGTGRLAWNRHFKANLPWEKLERNHKSITHNLSVKSLHCPKHWLVAGLATSHCLTQWMDTELTTLRIPNLPMQA